MDPAQMEGLLTNYYEYHFLYITGIHHVESKNIQGVALMKLTFIPAPTWPRRWPRRSTTSTARAPSCRRAPCRRSSCGSTPAACRSATWCSRATTPSIAEIQDLALNACGRCSPRCRACRRRRRSAAASAPIVVRVDPDRLRAYGMSPDEVIAAFDAGNVISPSGNVNIGDLMPHRAAQLRGEEHQRTARAADPAPGPGRPCACATSASSRTPPTSRPATRSSTAGAPSTSWSPNGPTPRRSTVVNEVKANLGRFQALVPDDIKVSFEFDQSPYVTRRCGTSLREGSSARCSPA